jgi:hypothetical protein
MEASPNFKIGKPSEDALAFLSRIRDANPNGSDLSEDDSDANWGHYQFTAGQLTISAVLADWDAVGSCQIACELIAAALKTCKVARHLCFERNVSATSYLSDAYLQNIVSKLWDLWQEAGGVSASYSFPLSLNTINTNSPNA